MYTVIRQYAGPAASQLLNLLEDKQDEVKRLISRVPGFVSYMALRTNDGGVTITVCQDKAGTDASIQIAADWVNENVSPEGTPATPTISEGDVAIHLNG